MHSSALRICAATQKKQTFRYRTTSNAGDFTSIAQIYERRRMMPRIIAGAKATRIGISR